MAAADAIRVEGVVVERLSERLVRVELANGHRLFGHGTKATQAKVAALKVGDRVWLEMSPADMSTGRLRFNEERARA